MILKRRTSHGIRGNRGSAGSLGSADSAAGWGEA
jgi:hypothetical protein